MGWPLGIRDFATARPIALLGGGGTFQVSDGQTLTLGGTLQGSNFTKVGGGTLVLAGTSSIRGRSSRMAAAAGNTSTLLGTIAFDATPEPDRRSVTFDRPRTAPCRNITASAA